MKKVLSILLVLFFALGGVFAASITEELGDMANQLVKVKAEGTKPRYAFVALTTDYKNTLVDNYVTDALTEAMFNTGEVKIIERANLEAILKEQDFQSSGLVNEENIKSIGKIAGADFVCYGTLKDLGGSITVNARVVDVESGELCAIARATIIKDEYLQRQVQSAVGTPSIVNRKTVKKASGTVTTSTNITNNAWKVANYEDEFGGCSYYIFIIQTSDTRKLFISYKKASNPANSKVISGVYWGYDTDNIYSTNNGAKYDIKGQDGTTITKELYHVGRQQLSQAQNDLLYYAWDAKAGARWLVEMIKNSDSVAVRRDGLSRRFQTAGLLDKMAEYDITWEEIDAAIANEEF